MTPQQFLDQTRTYPRADVERAEATVLAGGELPVEPDALRRFRLLVWLELQGKLRRTTPTHVHAS